MMRPAARPQASWPGWPDSPGAGLQQGSLGGGLVLVQDTGGDAPPRADRDAGLLRPRPNIDAALPACRAAPGLPPRSPSRLAGTCDERCQPPAERGGVAGAQVNLVAGAADGEPHRLIGRAAVEVVLQGDGYLLRHRGLLVSGIGYLTVQDRPCGRSDRNAVSCQPPHRRTPRAPWGPSTAHVSAPGQGQMSV